MRNMFLPHMASARWQSSFLSNATKPNLQEASAAIIGAVQTVLNLLFVSPPWKEAILKEGSVCHDPQKGLRT